MPTNAEQQYQDELMRQALANRQLAMQAGAAQAAARAQMYMADRDLQGKQYLADTGLTGTKYTSDNALAGVKDTNQAHLTGTSMEQTGATDRARIGADAQREVARTGIEPAMGALQIQRDLSAGDIAKAKLLADAMGGNGYDPTLRQRIIDATYPDRAKNEAREAFMKSMTDELAKMNEVLATNANPDVRAYAAQRRNELMSNLGGMGGIAAPAPTAAPASAPSGAPATAPPAAPPYMGAPKVSASDLMDNLLSDQVKSFVKRDEAMSPWQRAAAEGAGGALAGLGGGAAAGSAIPGLGTVIGAGLGSAALGIGGFIHGFLSGQRDPTPEDMDQIVGSYKQYRDAMARQIGDPKQAAVLARAQIVKLLDQAAPDWRDSLGADKTRALMSRLNAE